MSARNDNWVCFVCRTSRREPLTTDRIPTCHDCGAECFCIGCKFGVPKRDAVKEWRELQAEFTRWVDAGREGRRLRLTREKHFLEKEIARMEALPLNKDRTRQIKRLKEELARFTV